MGSVSYKRLWDDPRQVTVAGESAGGGADMLQTMVYGSTPLFRYAIVVTPYLLMQNS
jgi:carboxylesterase type B